MRTIGLEQISRPEFYAPRGFADRAGGRAREAAATQPSGQTPAGEPVVKPEEPGPTLEERMESTRIALFPGAREDDRTLHIRGPLWGRIASTLARLGGDEDEGELEIDGSMIREAKELFSEPMTLAEAETRLRELLAARAGGADDSEEEAGLEEGEDDAVAAPVEAGSSPAAGADTPGTVTVNPLAGAVAGPAVEEAPVAVTEPLEKPALAPDETAPAVTETGSTAADDAITELFESLRGLMQPRSLGHFHRKPFWALPEAQQYERTGTQESAPAESFLLDMLR